MANEESKESATGEASAKVRPISQILSLFVVLSIVVLGLMVLGLLSIRIGQAVYNSQQAHAHSQINVLANDISRYLRNMEQLLKDHANFPIMVQGVMHPEINRASLSDFMGSLTFLGEQYQLVLLDFSGSKVNASKELPDFNYTKEAWVNSVIEGGNTQYRGISRAKNGRHYWRLALPVLYNGLPEGILLVEIPVDKLDQKLTNENMGGLALDILWNDQIIKRIGEPIAKGVSVDVIEPVSGATLKFYIDTSIGEAVHRRLLIENSLLLLVFIVLATAVSIFLGNRWFVKPILQLRTFTRDLAENKHFESIVVNHDVKELRELANDFNQMAERIHRREDALTKSRDELKEVNEKLNSSQSQLIHSEKMASLGTLAAGVAHEINNPVSFIKGNISALQKYLGVLIPLFRDCQRLSDASEKERSALLEKINRCIEEEDIEFVLEDMKPLLDDTADGVERVKEIVAGLKSFVRIDEPDQQLFNVNDCVEITLKMVWNELKYKCVVNQNLGDVPSVLGNPGQINQVITNLLVNAAQAIPKQGEINIETSVDRGQVLLRVSDTGDGISEENMKKLFTPFFTTKEVGLGTGLGLSISYGIIEEHGGSISVDSEVGKGTSIYIRLPIPE